MHKSKSGETGHYEELFSRCFRPLCAFVYSYVPDIETVKDIVQDTFVALWNKRDQYSPTSTLLYIIAKNKTLDHLKAHPQIKMLKGISVDILTERLQADDSDDFDSREIVDHIWEFVETLPPRCRTIFRMSRRDGLKNSEIADQLDISVKAVEKQIGKAQSMIREHLLQNGIMSLVAWLIVLPE
jgi:RNA polymerase sigma-70 factor (ECF subfamily)